MANIKMRHLDVLREPQPPRSPSHHCPQQSLLKMPVVVCVCVWGGSWRNGGRAQCCQVRVVALWPYLPRAGICLTTTPFFPLSFSPASLVSPTIRTRLPTLNDGIPYTIRYTIVKIVVYAAQKKQKTG